MVVRIKTGKSIKGALTYNENKVKQGVAQIILASGFACDINELGFSQKLRRYVYYGDTGPVKTEDIGPVVTESLGHFPVQFYGNDLILGT